MSLTRIDCLNFRGERASQENSSFAALNPSRKPGSLVAAGARAARESLGGQVASRLSLEHFVEGVLDSFDGHAPVRGETAAPKRERSIDILEGAFRRANTSVYEFSHKLAAGGRMAASLVGLVIEERIVAAGRVGSGGIYLARGGESCPFFSADSQAPGLQNSIGENSLVTVELASISLEADDWILLFHRSLDSAEEERLDDHISVAHPLTQDRFETLLESVFGVISDIPFALALMVGPEAIYLNKVVSAGR